MTRDCMSTSMQNGSMVGGGAYWVEKDDLYVLREHIAAQPERFNQLLAARRFSSRYGGASRRAQRAHPQRIQSRAEICPHILNKQFFYMAELPVQHVTSTGLPRTRSWTTLMRASSTPIPQSGSAGEDDG